MDCRLLGCLVVVVVVRDFRPEPAAALKSLPLEGVVSLAGSWVAAWVSLGGAQLES